jgi:hypothetical protein
VSEGADEGSGSPACKCCDKPFSATFKEFKEMPLDDPDLGLVCNECFWRLKAVRNDLYTLSQKPI